MRKWNTSGRRASALGVAVLALLATAALLPPGASAADPDLIWKKGCEGSRRCIPKGLAADSLSGEIYASIQDIDHDSDRVEVLTPWGDLVRAWGWGVVDGSSELQVCGPGATPPSTCQHGFVGEGAGQFRNPRGIALDSSGDVYVVDRSNSRVQKFDSEGHFLLMFGGEVNKGGGTPANPGNICTAQYLANGDACGAGTLGTANGQFAEWPGQGAFIAIDRGSPDVVYVGDRDRIQKFDTEGHYIGEVPLPEPGVVGALAVDQASGDLYFAYASKAHNIEGIDRAEQPDVYRLDAATGSVIGKPLEARIPLAIATGPNGHVYIFDAESSNGNGGPQVPPNHLSRVLEFDASGNQVALLLEGKFDQANALATGTGCGIPGADLYVADNASLGRAFFAAYGPPPNPTLCPPPPAAPSIEATYATSVDTSGATVRAEINPHFWNDTLGFGIFGRGVPRETWGAPAQNSCWLAASGWQLRS